MYRSFSNTIRCAFTIICTFVGCYTFNCIFVDNCSSFTTTFSSLTSFCIDYASTKCCSSISFSFDSLMHTRSTNVAFGHVCLFARQHHLLLSINSIADVLIVSLSWIIVYTNCIFSLYDFLSANFEDDDECGGNFTTNGWIFNTPSLSCLFNSSFTFVLLNNSTSSSCIHLCSLLCASFSFAIRYSFSIALSTLILMWTPKLKKCAQIPETNTNCFQ